MFGTAAAEMPGLVAGYFLRTSAVLAAALIAASAAKRRPAALRHFLLSSALVGLLLLPFLSLAPVGWRTALVPRWMAPGAEAAAQPAIGTDAGAARPLAVAGAPAEAAAIGGLSVETAPAGPVPLREGLPVRVRDPRPEGSAGRPLAAGLAGQAALPAAPSSPPVESGRGRRPVDLLIAILWSAGLAVLVLRLGVGLSGALRLTAEGRPLGGPAWRSLLERFLALVPLRRGVRLKSHPEVLVPLTWGWRKPVVIMPPGADGWTEEERSSALFHELSHIKRGDFAVMLLVRASLAVFWWNPLCWVAYRELLKAQELACDELVLRAGIRPSSYAASLLAFRRSAGFRWTPSAALLGLLGRTPFQDRLAAILRQKLTYMEVKMKTKIMMALALTLAVALVGTARPVAGNETGQTATVLAETTLPAPVPFEAVAPAPVQETKAEQEKAKQAEKAKEAEKAKAAEKARAAVEKTIVISPKGGAGKPIEVVITEGGETKTLVFEKPLTITKGKDGDFLVLSIDGKEVQVLKGEPLRLEIKGGGELKVVHEPGLVKIDEGGVVKIVKEGGEKGGAVVYYGHVKPEVVVETKPKVIVETTPHVIVKMGKDAKEGETWVQVAPVTEGKNFKVVREAKPAVAWAIKEGDKAFAFAPGIGGGEMLEKIKALQEQVQAIKAKKMDLSALEESLKKLEAELKAKEEKLREFEFKFDKAPGQYTIVKRAGGEVEGKTDVWVMEKDKAAQTAKAKVMIGTSEKDGRTISLVFTGHEGEAGKAAFERSIAALKTALPEGYKIVEQEFDAEKGTMTFKIAGPEGAKLDETLVRKLVETVQKSVKSEK